MKNAFMISAICLVLSCMTGCISPKEYHPPTSAKSLTVKSEIRWNVGFLQRDFIYPPGAYPAFTENAQGVFYHLPTGSSLDPKARNRRDEGLFVSHDGTRAVNYMWPTASGGELLYAAAGSGRVPMIVFPLPKGWESKVQVNKK